MWSPRHSALARQTVGYSLHAPALGDLAMTPPGVRIESHGQSHLPGSVIPPVTLLMERLRAGKGGALFVIGEAGLGKSTVLAQAMALAGAGATRLGVGRADPTESSLPFGLFTQVFDTLGGRAILAAAGRAPLDDGAESLYRAHRWLESTATSPLLLGLDDLQWSDADSLAMLSFLVRRIEHLRVAIVATLRPWPCGAEELCLSLANAGYATIERLTPLTESAASLLLIERSGRQLSEDATRKAWELTAGNPLLLTQVAMELEHRGTLLEPELNGTPRFADRLLIARFAGLPPAGVQCAQTGSVLGARFHIGLAADMAHLDEREAHSAIEALCRSGLLRHEQGSSVEFVHPLFRQALYNDLPGPLRSLLHARAFALLADRGMEFEAGEHAVHADLRGDIRAINILRSSGRTALDSGAPTMAAERLRGAVEVAGELVEADLLIELAEVLVFTGCADAVDASERALRLDLPPATRIRPLRLLARALSMGNAHDAAERRFEEAAALAETHDPAAAVDVLLDQALTSCYTRGPKSAHATAMRARELATCADEATQRRANAAWGYIALQLGDPSGVEAIATAAAPALVDPHSDVHDVYFPCGRLSLHGAATALVERFEPAGEAYRLLETAATRVGALPTLAAATCDHGWTLAHMGRLNESLAHLDRSLELANAFPFIEPLASARRAYVLLVMGGLDESDAACRRLEAMAPPELTPVRVPMLHTRGYRSYREGRLTEASDTFLMVEALMESMGLREPCGFRFGRHAIAAHAGCGRIDDARRVLEWLRRCGDRLPCRYPRIAAATGVAMLAEHDGDHPAANLAHQQALKLNESVDLPVELVETLLAYGAFLRRRRQPAAARPLLNRAVEVAERAGANWLAGYAREELHIAGGRRRPAHDAQDELTRQEERVARLAAGGGSNREIAEQLSLSVKTVETHLQHIYAKLGIHSRRKLMQIASPDGTGGHDALERRPG